MRIHFPAARKDVPDQVGARISVFQFARRHSRPVLVANVHHSVERRAPAGVGHIGVRAAIEHELRKCVVLVHDRDNQRAGAIHIRLVDIQSGIEHDLRGIDVTFPRGKQECSEAAAGKRRD